jgi:hypothetical protein
MPKVDAFEKLNLRLLRIRFVKPELKVFANLAFCNNIS